MASNASRIVTALVAVGLVVLALAAGDATDPIAPAGVTTAVGALRRADPVVVANPRDAERTDVVERVVESAADVHSVPIRVTLERVRSAALERLARSDSSSISTQPARLRGQVIGRRGQPLIGELHFVEGPNRGRRFVADAFGRFECVGLHAGRQVFEIRQADTCIARRPVRLRPGAEAHFVLPLASPATITGRVVDADGVPIAGAVVAADGMRVATDARGAFELSAVPFGATFVDVEAPGQAFARREVAVRPGQRLDADALTVTVARAARLRLCPPHGVNGGIRVWVLPATIDGADVVPWQRFADLELGTEPLTLDGLPEGSVRVFAYAEGYASGGGSTICQLRAGCLAEHVILLEPLPLVRGQVLRGGQPVADVRVESTATDPRTAGAELLGLGASSFDSALLPLLPPVVERTVSDVNGRFTLAGGLGVPALRDVAVFEAGALQGNFVLRRGAAEIALDLDESGGSRSQLALDFVGADVALDVEVVVDGKCRDASRRHSAEPLVVPDLGEGVWHLVVRSGAVDLLRDPELALRGSERVRVALPR